jgi:hypothetical protein
MKKQFSITEEEKINMIRSNVLLICSSWYANFIRLKLVILTSLRLGHYKLRMVLGLITLSLSQLC